MITCPANNNNGGGRLRRVLENGVYRMLTTETSCVGCQNNFYMDSSANPSQGANYNPCLAQCAAGFWADSRISDATPEQTDWSGVCTACNQGPNACTTCHGPALTDCDSCKDGWFHDGSNGCVPCDSKCATCNGAGNDKC